MKYQKIHRKAQLSLLVILLGVISYPFIDNILSFENIDLPTILEFLKILGRAVGVWICGFPAMYLIKTWTKDRTWESETEFLPMILKFGCLRFKEINKLFNTMETVHTVAIKMVGFLCLAYMWMLFSGISFLSGYFVYILLL